MAKKYLENLRLDSLNTVNDMGFMNPTIDNVLHNDVLPWLKKYAENFVIDSGTAIKHAAELLDEGVSEAQRQHSKTIQKKLDQ